MTEKPVTRKELDAFAVQAGASLGTMFQRFAEPLRREHAETNARCAALETAYRTLEAEGRTRDAQLKTVLRDLERALSRQAA